MEVLENLEQLNIMSDDNFKSHAQVVVIGGGLIGCSILYHLTKLGWNDVVLLERDELTSGSTWHAAANIHGLHDSNNISRLQYYTMKLYEQLEKETGQSCGIFQPGSLYLAQTKDRENQLRIQAAKARYFGVDFHELSQAEAAELNPLVNFDGIRCIMFEPDGGNVDPSGVTHAYAIGARKNGAKIYRFTPALETNMRPDGSWDVVTPKGTIHAQIIVNAAGLWGREVAGLAGYQLPLMTMEHQYLVTEDIPEIAGLDRRLPSVSDRDGEYYMRQEVQGLLVGAYEQDGRFWAENGTPLDFGHELFSDDLDRIEPNILRACERVPALARAGIKKVINGPMIWTPDAAALYGPVPELQNYFVCNGIIPGFSQSGGLGLMLAQWIVEGEPELDMFPWDMARYGLDWTPKSFVKARALDCYSHRFKIHFPYEEREAGRPVRTRPVYKRQKNMGAVFGLNASWEHPLWYAKDDVEPVDSYGYERQPWWRAVRQECKTLREHVGILDISNFAKYEIRGKGAKDWLNGILANRMPTKTGRSCLSPLIGLRGGIAGDFTVTKVGEDHYYMFGSATAERYHSRYFSSDNRPDGVEFISRTKDWCGFNVAGPKSRALLSELTDADLSNGNFPFFRSHRIELAGLEVFALRVSFTGDLGWELYVKEADQSALLDALLTAGEKHQATMVGSRSLLSLRVEKGYGSWGREYSPEFWPQEVGLAPLVKMSKPDFHGRSAYYDVQENVPRFKLVMFSVETPHEADASGGEAIFLPDGTPVGYVSTGAYSHTTDQSLAMGFIKPHLAGDSQDFEIYILGLPHKARLLAEPPFDPDGARLKG